MDALGKWDRGKLILNNGTLISGNNSERLVRNSTDNGDYCGDFLGGHRCNYTRGSFVTKFFIGFLVGFMVIGSLNSFFRQSYYTREGDLYWLHSENKRRLSNLKKKR